MYAVYAFIVFIIIRLILADRGHTPGKKLRRFILIFWTVLLLFTVVLLLIFPYNKMNKPDGEFEVGTLSFDIVDTGRAEIYGKSPGENRKIRVQFWYPAADTGGLKKNKWLTDGVAVAEMIPKFAGMPSFMMRYLARIDSNSFENAPIIKPETAYPVVVMSHGWLGYRNLHSDFGELLASNGYIAIGIDHTYGSLATAFDDGTTVQVDLNALPDMDDGSFPEYANRLVKTYSLDSKLVLDTIELLNTGISDNTSLNEPVFFKDCMNLDAIGLIGHSTGGGGITRLAMTDERVKALFGLDPWVEPVEMNLLENGLSVPSIFFRSEQWADRNNNKYLQIIEAGPDTQTLMYQLNGTYHQDFSMIYMFEPVNRIFGFSGRIDSRRSTFIQQDFILKFFNDVLIGNGEAFSSFAAEYPEVVDIFWQE